MYEATTSQVYNLCTLGTAASVGSGQGDYIDALVRARIFWYGYVLDGVTSALRGGRMLLYAGRLFYLSPRLVLTISEQIRRRSYSFRDDVAL